MHTANTSLGLMDEYCKICLQTMQVEFVLLGGYPLKFTFFLVFHHQLAGLLLCLLWHMQGTKKFSNSYNGKVVTFPLFGFGERTNTLCGSKVNRWPTLQFDQCATSNSLHSFFKLYIAVVSFSNVALLTKLTTITQLPLHGYLCQHLHQSVQKVGTQT